MFDLTYENTNINTKVFENIKIINGRICKETLHKILEEDGFIFI